MPNYTEKMCELCKSVFIPTSPKQKYCDGCKDEGRKIADRIRDRRRNAKKFGYEDITRVCEACGEEFTTKYKNKRFCGSEECDKIRCQRKAHVAHLRRDKELLRIKSRKYYADHTEMELYRKSLSYRQTHLNVKEYEHKVNVHTIDFVKSYVESFGYKLISTQYKNNREKIVLECPEGHIWKTSFHAFKDANARCLPCYINNNYVSRPEQKLLDYFIDRYNNLTIVHRDRSIIPPQEIDIYFPERKLAIEVCGLYWHSEVSGCKKSDYHYQKMIKCFNIGIRLITVFEDELRDKFDIVVSRIEQALGMSQYKLYARKCCVEEILVGEANKFCEKYHVQGPSTATNAWGLFYNKELVQVCSIGSVGRKHVSKEGMIELKRFCSKTNLNVVGGFSKLFKCVINHCIENNLTVIKSYCDMRYGNIFSPVYELTGFILQSHTKYTPHYIKRGCRFRNFSLRKTPEERLTGKTEWELRKSQGYDRIWDCGHRTYIYKI